MREVAGQTDIGRVARSIQVAVLHARLHRATRLVQVSAVVEAAPFARVGELGKVVAQCLRSQVPEAELANSRRIDQQSAAAQVVQRGGSGCMTAGAAAEQ